jgi:hypothetical protein
VVPRRPSFTRRWLLAATWPVGVTLTSWDYMWRSTPLHRREVLEAGDVGHLPPDYPPGIDDADVHGYEHGHGPLFHRTYRTAIREAQLTPEALMAALQGNLNRAAPTKFARFQRVLGDGEAMSVGDEYVVRMPGPWDGPVRVVARDARSFRLATLMGHLEAGQIEFRVRGGEPMEFEIESWARSADRLSNLLYHHVRMAKEIQLHMWISFLEGVVAVAGGRMTGGVDIDTRRIEDGLPE